MEFLRKRESRDLLALVALALLPRLIYYFSGLLSQNGLPQAHDTQWYLEHAELLISSFHIDIDFNGIFYLSYYSLLAVMLLVFKTQAGVVFVQILINAFSVILVYKISLMLFNRRAAIISGIVYAFLFPVIYWSMYLITDSLFISLMLLQAYFLIKACDSKRKVFWCLFWGTSLYMVFFRPTGIVTLAFLLPYIIINSDFKNYVRKHKVYILCTCVVAAAGVLYISASDILEPLKKSLYYNMRWLLLDNYSNGRIYDIATPYDYGFEPVNESNYLNNFILSFFINNWKHILILYARRIISFSGVWVWKLAGADAFTALKYLLPSLAALAALGAGIARMAVCGILRKSFLLILEVLSIMFFTVFFFMDSAYRYRVPSLVFLGMICAYGLDIYITMGAKCFKRLKGMVFG